MLYKIVIFFFMHQHESVTGIHVSPHDEAPSHLPLHQIPPGCPRALHFWHILLVQVVSRTVRQKLWPLLIYYLDIWITTNLEDERNLKPKLAVRETQRLTEPATELRNFSYFWKRERVQVGLKIEGLVKSPYKKRSPDLLPQVTEPFTMLIED